MHAELHGIRARLEHGDDRAAPTRARNRASVVSIAVGWCAKSSYTVTPPTTPRTSMRRLTPRSARALRRALGRHADVAAAAIAASAFITLCAPISGQSTSPRVEPDLRTSNRRLAVPCSTAALQSASRLGRQLKVSHGVQQPFAQRLGEFGIVAVDDDPPARGTVRSS
jgi:hypothetical protein